MSEIVVRPVEPGDLAGDMAGVVPLAGSPERAEARLRAAACGDESMSVAVRSGRIVGVVSIRWTETCDPPYPWMYGLHVADDVQRQGLGRTLVRTAEDLAREHGDSHLSLDVDEDGPIAFYEALGYEVIRNHEHHWRSGDAEGVSSCLIMRKALR